MHDKDKEKVIKAIGELGRRVTPADVATKTGLPVLSVQRYLNQVALETKGHLQVGNTGDIVYGFAPGFSNAYLAQGIAAVFATASKQTMDVLFYLLRISFGIALILSLVIVVVLIVILVTVMTQAMTDRRDDRGGAMFDMGDWGFHFSFWDWMILRDLLYWNMYTRSAPVYYDYSRPTVRARQRSNFLLNCFSFLFGDGDPNEGLDEKRWQLIAQVLKKNNNVVTAEQLAPYLGSDPKNEDAVLPVLVRFNGRPEVTESGKMVYVFESLQTTAADQHVNPPSYLQEFPWKFTNVSQSELVPVYVVAGLNFAGAWVLFNLLQYLNVAAQQAAIPAGQSVMATGTSLGPLFTLCTALCVYGSLFVGIPLVRAIVNNIRNKQIEARNLKRFRYAQMVSSPTPELMQKLGEAREYKLRERHVEDKDVVYTTEKDALDQQDALSEKFTQMERQQHAAGGPGSLAGGAKEKEAQAPSQQQDPGAKIKIPKYQEEFDASP